MASETFTVGAVVGVVGLGTMGAGIAEVFARSGFQVVGVERDDDALAAGRGHLERSTARAVERGRLEPATRDEILNRVRLGTDLAALAPCRVVVEAVPERLDIKRDLFARLDAVVGAEAVLATNTSSLPVTEIATATERPERVVGMHFFNPAPVLRLVEVVRTVRTSAEVVADVSELARQVGKTPVVCADRAGFVANALLFGYLNQAATLLESGAAIREDIDVTMRAAYGFPMGPLALLDLIGLDTALQILETMYGQSRSRRHAPAPVLRELVAAGWLGRKSGRGFYAYPGSAGGGPDGSPAGRAVGTVGVVDERHVAGALVGALEGGDPRIVRADAARLADVADADVVVVGGAPPELFRSLDAVCKPGALLVAAQPDGPVVACAAATDRPGDVAGIHLVGDRLAEVVATVATSGEAAATVSGLCRAAGLDVVRSPDRAGFLAEALLFPYLNDAVAMLGSGYATAADIDTAMTLGCGLPAGPIAMLDQIGPDRVRGVLKAMYADSGEPSVVPAPLLGQLAVAVLRAGDL